MKEQIEIKKTPKLGTTKDTIKLFIAITKEYANYKKKLGKGALQYFVKSTRRGQKVARFVDPFKKKNETFMGSPDIVIEGKKYWVIRFGQSVFKVRPSRNFPTGYMVFDNDDIFVDDLQQSKNVCKLYQIWERFYVFPLMIPKYKTQIEWIRDFKEKLFQEIIHRRQSEYSEMEGSEEEKEALQELDDEICSFHDADMELLALEERLGEIQFEVFDRPSDTYINEFIKLTYRFNELMSLEKQYLDRRIRAWKKYSHLLERKYKVKINLSLDVTHISLAVLFDLIKYVFFERIIPETVLGKISFDVVKSIGEAKVKEFLLNLIIHYGGLISLEKQAIGHKKMQETIQNYIKIWESDIPDEMLRPS